MRLWSLHPKYLDVRGLVAAWREALLAQAVLEKRTAGYRHHPQLDRFRVLAHPRAAIAMYLRALLREGIRRGYRFQSDKIHAGAGASRIRVSRTQLLYEWAHLKAKVKRRDPRHYRTLLAVSRPVPHPLFTVGPGLLAPWERVRGKRSRRDDAG